MIRLIEHYQLMKYTLTPLALATLLLGLTGCGDKSEAPKASGSAATESKPAAEMAEKAAAAIKETAQPVVAAANDAAAKLVTQAKETVDKAQQLFSQGKLQEAQDALKAIADVKLPPDLQKLVDDLKAKIEQGLAAAKNLGGEALKKLPSIPKP